MVRANSSGTVDGYAKYDPFGKVLTALSGVPFGFTGARYDSVIANYALGSRRYDPAQGRFTTRDTWPANVWEPWTWNLYQYCKNSPQNYIDPTGHYEQGSDDECPQYLPDGTPTWLVWEKVRAAAEVSQEVARAVDHAVGGAAITLTLAAWLNPGFRRWALTGVVPAEGVLGFVAGGQGSAGVQQELYEAAQAVAQQFGGVLEKTRGSGWKVVIDNAYGKLPATVRFMAAGSGGRVSSYFRVAIPGKGALTLGGAISSNPSLTHIDLTANYLGQIGLMLQNLGAR